MRFDDELKAFRDHVLRLNPYMDQGFAKAWLDEDSGGIYADRNDGAGQPDVIAVFPNDRLGNYFYLRQEMQYRFANDPRVLVADGFAGGVLQVATVHLVAVVTDAKESKLLDRLMHTVGGYPAGIVRPVSADWNREEVTARELQYCDESEIQHALQNLGRQRIVSLELSLSAELFYQNPNCLQDPF